MKTIKSPSPRSYAPPWTEQEKQIVASRYRFEDAKSIALDIGRTENSVRAMARSLRIINDNATSWSERYPAEEEKAVIVEQVEFMIRSICGDDEARLEKSLIFLRMIAEANSAQWFFDRKHWRLGKWCETFIPGYVWKPIFIKREDFFNAEGTFGEQIVEEFAYHRTK